MGPLRPVKPLPSALILVVHRPRNLYPLRTMPTIRLDTGKIKDWDTFHDVFTEVFGFPDFYERTMKSWVECMTWLDQPKEKLTKIHATDGGVVVLQLDHVTDFSRRCPEQYAAIVENAAYVNFRRGQADEKPVLALAFFKREE